MSMTGHVHPKPIIKDADNNDFLIKLFCYFGSFLLFSVIFFFCQTCCVGFEAVKHMLGLPFQPLALSKLEIF